MISRLNAGPSGRTRYSSRCSGCASPASPSPWMYRPERTAGVHRKESPARSAAAYRNRNGRCHAAMSSLVNTRPVSSGSSKGTDSAAQHPAINRCCDGSRPIALARAMLQCPSLRVLRLITRLNIGGPSIQAITLSDLLTPRGFTTRLVHGSLGAGEGDMSYLIAPSTAAEHVPSLRRELSPADDYAAY